MRTICLLQVEQDAVELEGDESSRLRIAEALRDLLVQKGIITMQVSVYGRTVFVYVM